jgi:NADP-dependent 3-hydroxy acid dehydrogenase YdfG
MAASLVVLCAYRLYEGRLDPNSKIVLVTGAGSGLGKATAKLFISRGDKVVAIDINKAALEALQLEVGGSAVIIADVDVTSAASVQAAVSIIEKQMQLRGWSGLDAVVNFAGLIFGGPLVEMDDKQLELVLDVNIKGVGILIIANPPTCPLHRYLLRQQVLLPAPPQKQGSHSQH